MLLFELEEILEAIKGELALRLTVSDRLAAITKIEKREFSSVELLNYLAGLLEDYCLDGSYREEIATLRHDLESLLGVDGEPEPNSELETELIDSATLLDEFIQLTIERIVVENNLHL